MTVRWNSLTLTHSTRNRKLSDTKNRLRFSGFCNKWTPPTGPQQFCKIGTRNAMVIAVAAFGLALHPDRRAVGTGIGSAAPTPRRAVDAERFLAGELAAAGLWESRGALPEGLARAFGERVAAATAPIDDVRGSAAYRRHSIGVLARRAATWAWTDYRKAA